MPAISGPSETSSATCSPPDDDIMAEFNGVPNGEGRRYAVLVSRFNNHVTSKLADGAMDALVRHGVTAEDVDLVWVPGAWELPFAARRLAATDRYSALVVLGAIVRGGTPHFDFISAEASRGVMDASTEYDVPIGFGLLTCDTMEQAEARAGGEHGNKGWDAAIAALEMSDLFERLDGSDEG